MKSSQQKPIALLTFVLLLFCASTLLNAQTTGKISGKVLDAETGEALPGANVQLVGTSIGAAASLEGDYFILNVPPGTYNIRAQFMGYRTSEIRGLQVSVNRTANANFNLSPTIIEGETVVVEAEKVAIKKDQTSSVRNVSNEQMNILPVESVGQVVSLQSGVVEGHFRGGRSNEVSYLIDGMQVTNSFNSSGQVVGLEADAVEEVEVIKGTFNAEYGRAMSGIVNAVTKDGSNTYHGSVSASLANYLTGNKDIFWGLEDDDFDRQQDYKFQLSGPIFKDRLTFFTNYRYQNNKGHLNGMRMFRYDDESFFNDPDPSRWRSEKTGDSSVVAMNWNTSHNFTGKLTSKLSQNLRVTLLYILNAGESQGYDHNHKYHPDGRATSHSESHMASLNWNHMISPAIFYEAKIGYIYNWNGYYQFENPFDPRYVNDIYDYNTGPGFYTGGMNRTHSTRYQRDLNGKLDFTWQIHKNHSIKTGFDYYRNDLENNGYTITNYYMTTDSAARVYKPWIWPDTSQNYSNLTDEYRKKPIDFSFYLQDKMEFDEMVINFGLRYDYYDPQTTYPSNRRNPLNRIDRGEEFSSTMLEAEAQSQISPRLGLSYQLGEAALLHFSYGHFFQRPAFENFYNNDKLTYQVTAFSTISGNPTLKAQKTVQYEIGLWQQLMTGMGLEVSVFYRDIYDLLSVAPITDYNGTIYGIYTNLDYGNAKGVELTYDLDFHGIYASMNYTLQYTRGNADNPTTTFNRLGNSQDPIPRLIPMSWDQRHTLNASVGYRTKDWGVSGTGTYGSGSPYTFSPLPETQLEQVNLYPNNATQPSKYSVDLYGYYRFPMMGKYAMKLEMYVYNLLDRLNENGVYGRTGRAYTNIVLDTEQANYHSDFSTYVDSFQNPSMYSAPRLVKIGLGIEF
ncbi:MAG TPA: TonB-dependent receptor [bacterium]|nr:TonB-dependent receptor [bacterium]